MIEDVPSRSTVVGNPGHPVRVEGRKVEGPDVDWIHLPDPVADAIKQLSERIVELEGRLAELDGKPAEGRRPRAAAPAGPLLGGRLSHPRVAAPGSILGGWPRTSLEGAFADPLPARPRSSVCWRA